MSQNDTRSVYALDKQVKKNFKDCAFAPPTADQGSMIPSPKEITTVR